MTKRTSYASRAYRLAIARKLDLNFKTVRRYLLAGNVDALLAGGVRVSVLDPFKPYLHDRLARGMPNAAVLHREIAERGYTGGYNTLARYLRPLHRAEAATLTTLPPPPAVRPAMISVRFFVPVETIV